MNKSTSATLIIITTIICITLIAVSYISSRNTNSTEEKTIISAQNSVKPNSENIAPKQVSEPLIEPEPFLNIVRPADESYIEFVCESIKKLDCELWGETYTNGQELERIRKVTDATLEEVSETSGNAFYRWRIEDKEEISNLSTLYVRVLNNGDYVSESSKSSF